MAVAVNDYVTSGSWAASYLQCLSRCSRRWRRLSPGHRGRGKDGAAGRAGANVEQEAEEREEQLMVVRVSDVYT